jgi:hypothetical protein
MTMTWSSLRRRRLATTVYLLELLARIRKGSSKHALSAELKKQKITAGDEEQLKDEILAQASPMKGRAQKVVYITTGAFSVFWMSCGSCTSPDVQLNVLLPTQ